MISRRNFFGVLAGGLASLTLRRQPGSAFIAFDLHEPQTLHISVRNTPRGAEIFSARVHIQDAHHCGMFFIGLTDLQGGQHDESFSAGVLGNLRARV